MAQPVDPHRSKRFQDFFTKHLPLFADAASQGFARKGPGVLVYHPPDDRFDRRVASLKFEYKARAEVEAAPGGAGDDLVRGMLGRYDPPNEALFVAVYPDKSYDVSRVVLRPPGHAGTSGDPAP